MARARFKPGMTKYGRRHKPGEMNQTERLYADLLEARKQVGEILDWQFESVKLRLADLCFYTPDFLVLLVDGEIEFVDTKGGGPIDDKSVVTVTCAAEKVWFWKFAVEKRLPKKDGGGWKRTEY